VCGEFGTFCFLLWWCCLEDFLDVIEHWVMVFHKLYHAEES